MTSTSVVASSLGDDTTQVRWRGRGWGGGWGWGAGALIGGIALGCALATPS